MCDEHLRLVVAVLAGPEQRELPAQQRERAVGVVPEEIPRARGVVARHLGRAQRAAERALGERDRVVVALPPAAARARHPRVDPVRLGVVPDPQVHAAVRSDQREVALRERVVGGDGQDRSEHADPEQHRRRPFTDQARPARPQHPERNERNEQQHVRPRERGEAPGESRARGARPPRGAIEAEREPERREHQRHDERLAHQLAVEVDQQPIRGCDRRGEQRRARLECAPAHRVDETHAGRAERALDQARQQQSVAEHKEDRGEEPRIERSAEERAARERRVFPAGRGRARPIDVERGVEDRDLVRLHREHEDQAQREANEHQRADREQLSPRSKESRRPRITSIFQSFARGWEAGEYARPARSGALPLAHGQLTGRASAAGDRRRDGGVRRICRLAARVDGERCPQPSADPARAGRRRAGAMDLALSVPVRQSRERPRPVARRAPPSPASTSPRWTATAAISAWWCSR